METNGWKDFMRKLLRDFRTSGYLLQKEFGISQVAIHQIISGQTKKPQQRTIKKLEEALGIVIHDEDPTNLHYSIPAKEPDETEKNKFHTYSLKGRFDNVDVREEAYE